MPYGWVVTSLFGGLALFSASTIPDKFKWVRFFTLHRTNAFRWSLKSSLYLDWVALINFYDNLLPAKLRNWSVLFVAKLSIMADKWYGVNPLFDRSKWVNIYLLRCFSGAVLLLAKYLRNYANADSLRPAAASVSFTNIAVLLIVSFDRAEPLRSCVRS